MENQTSSQWITVNEALKLLKMTSRTTLYKYANKYKIRATKPMGRTYFNLADIMATMDDNSITMGL